MTAIAVVSGRPDDYLSEDAEHLPGDVTVVPGLADLRGWLTSEPSARLVVFGADIALADALAFAAEHRTTRPLLGTVLVRSRVTAPVLVEALRAGIREVVTDDGTDSVGQACERSLTVSAALAAADSTVAEAAPHSAKIVTVFSAKGGCGKTTVSTNLAVAFAQSGKSTCLLDVDFYDGDVCIVLQLFPHTTIADAANLHGTLDASAVASLVTKHHSGVDVIAAPLRAADGDSVPSALVLSLLTALRGLYDVVVVDTPPSFTDAVLTAFDVSDLFLLLATLDIPALKSLKLTMETLDSLQYDPARRCVVLNRSDSNVGLTLTDVEKTLGIPINVHIPSSRDVPLSINKGVPIVLDQPKHPVSAAIRKLAVLPDATRVVPLPAGKGRNRRFLRTSA